MDLNISKIVQDKIDELHTNGTIENQIKESTEKTISKAITDALEDYSLKRKLEKQVCEQITSTFSQIDLSTYNGMISKTISKLINEVLNDDMQQKVEKTLSDLMFEKYENVKLSDIFKEYRAFILDYVEERDKYDYVEFLSDLSYKDDDSYFEWYYAKFSKENDDETPDIQLTFLKRKEEDSCYITRISLKGERLDNTFRISVLNSFERKMLNLYYNKVQILIDIDEVDEDNYYDIDM